MRCVANCCGIWVSRIWGERYLAAAAMAIDWFGRAEVSVFIDRFDGGRQLAERLKAYAGQNAVVLAIPRGGLQTGYAVATTLKLPLDVVLIKKIGHPYNPELAIGAVSLTGRVLNEEIPAPEEYIEAETRRLREVLKRRHEQYQADRPPLDLQGRIAIIVDDGIATGSTMLATIELVKTLKPAKTIMAVPVAPPHSLEKFRRVVDEVVCLESPEYFMAVGQFYERFPQVEDEEAIRLLREANA